AALLGMPTYFEIHSPIKDSGKLTKIFFEKMIHNKNFKKLILITQSLKDYYIQEYPTLKDKILVLPDGADEIDLNNTTKLNIKKEKTNIG
ncbi:hypothetical protein ACOL22_11765, partial [Aliarcobacter butzleri]